MAPPTPKPLRRTRVWCAALACIAVIGCGPGDRRTDAPVFQGAEPLGQPGRQPGQFSKPRAVTVTASGEIVVIDRTGRVQFYDLEDGSFIRQWRLAEWENGTPTGISLDPSDDTLWLADTHYSRILNYDVEGNLLASWGKNGEETGHMIFPTDIALDPDGRTVWVTEYGRRNRIMKFTREGEFLMEWGSQLYDNDELGRPMAIALSPDSQRLFVVDAGNHRIRVFDREGNELQNFGKLGYNWGEMKYPLDMALGPDGLLYIVEYENSRLSRYSQEGDFIDSWGEAGSRAGQLFLPWGCAVAHDGTLIIADTNNERLQIVREPSRVFHRQSPHRDRNGSAIESAGARP